MNKEQIDYLHARIAALEKENERLNKLLCTEER